MAITYHAGRRIQGLSTDNATTTETITATGTYAVDFPVGSYDNDKQGFYVANTSSVVYGKTINSVSFWLKRGSSTTGTAYVRVWSGTGNGNAGTQVHEFGSIALSALTTSFVKHTFSTGSHTLAVNDTVGVEFSGGSSSTSPVLQGATTDVYDGVNTIRNRNTTGGTFSPVTTHDVKFEVTVGDTKPTDVQVGSRFEETDTRKMYYYGGGGGSITKDNQDIVQRGSATPSNGSGTGLVSGTFSNFAVGNNSNRVLIIASGCYNAAPNITGVTFNGSENFEKITQYKPASGFNHEFWILYNPTVTTADVVITYGSAGGAFQAGAGQTGAICYSFYNVKQSDAFGTPVEKNSSASATPFIAITPTTAGSMIIDCYFSGAGSPVPNNDETDGMNIICGGVDRSMASQYDLNPTIGSANNMSRTSGNDSYSQIAVEIKVAVDEWKELGT